MYKLKIPFLVIAIVITITSISQPNWEKLNLQCGGQFADLSNISGIAIKNDSTLYLKSSIAYGTKFIYHNLLELNLLSGNVSLIDTNSSKISILFYKNSKLYGLGLNLYQYNFVNNKWDSINDFWIYAYNKRQEFCLDVDADNVLIFGKKIEKLTISNNTRKSVCDYSIFGGACKTSKNFYSIYQTFNSLGKNYDSVFLLVLC